MSAVLIAGMGFMMICMSCVLAGLLLFSKWAVSNKARYNKVLAGYSFSQTTALKELNTRRATEGLKPLVLDAGLMQGAQARADKGIFPHELDDYLKAGACENLSVECTGSGDDVVRWALFKLWDFEKQGKNGATAPGSPCFAIIPSDQGHYKSMSDRVPTCTSGKVGFGVGKLTKMNGAPAPSYATHLVVIWVK